ncbi:hypothetical protein IAQ61_004560 [Plenodomus lingam]|nr:hypothetical protein IAQ61_004560 [Plenodomus lingam]
MISRIPAPIVLDTTLRDLYASAGDDENIILVYAVPTADIQMSAGVPISRKFSYQSPACPTKDSDILAREFLQLVPQLFGFIAGKMPLILFDLDPDQDETSSSDPSSQRSHRMDAYNVFDRLDPSQRPFLDFVPSAESIPLESTSRLAIINPMDCLLPYPHLVSPEAHYTALSKRALAKSPLPTPTTLVIDTILGPAQTSDAELLVFEAERMLKPLTTHALPFVAKLPQALSGQGVFLIRTEEERAAALAVLQPETLRMLRGMNEENAHLDTCCILAQDLLPGDAVALSLFITKDGKAVFNACCTQLVDSEGNWGGGSLDYREQDQLREKYRSIMAQLASYVHTLGYWGPMGADIMTDEEGHQLVIDMNIRVTGSHPLGALRGHFTRLGLNVAVLLFPLLLRLTKDQFEREFEEELHSGSLVVNAWVHMRDRKTSMTTITLAAGGKESLDEFLARVNVFKIEMH